MVMGVFAEIRNGFECFCKCSIFVFQIWVKKNSVPGSILVFGNVCFNIVRINHDNVASRGAVGRTHTIADCRQESVEKLERRILGVSCMYWICTTGFRVVGLLCARLISVSFPATTPRATTPHVSLFSGYHAEGYHARTDTFKLTGYHVCRVTTPELPRSIQTSGYRRVITPAGSF